MAPHAWAALAVGLLVCFCARPAAAITKPDQFQARGNPASSSEAGQGAGGGGDGGSGCSGGGRCLRAVTPLPPAFPHADIDRLPRRHVSTAGAYQLDQGACFLDVPHQPQQLCGRCLRSLRPAGGWVACVGAPCNLAANSGCQPACQWTARGSANLERRQRAALAPRPCTPTLPLPPPQLHNCPGLGELGARELPWRPGRI